jgi:hypothetical protein
MLINGYRHRSGALIELLTLPECPTRAYLVRHG